MSLLSPLFLLGLLGIGLPIWLHRLQTQTTEREKFSSTMFLEASQQRVHVQRKLRYLLLLALRILLLAILAFAFTRPMLELAADTALTEEDTHHVIVMDTSFSMNRGDSLEQARQLATEIIDTMDDGDQASLYTASSRVTTIAERSANREALRQNLQGLSPDNGRLDLGAMISALNGLIGETQGNVLLHLVSDFQESGQPVRFADLIPDQLNGRRMGLALERVTSLNNPNWVVEAVAVDIDEATVSVRGYHTEAAEKTVQLTVNGEVQGELTMTVPAAGRASFLFQDLEFSEGDNRVDARLLESDALPADDSRRTVLDNAPPAPVLLLTSNADSLAVTYITAALETAPRPYEAEVEAIADLDARILQRYPWVMVEDIGAVNQSLEQALRDYVNNGGAVLAALGERSGGLTRIPLGGQELAGNASLQQQARRGIVQIDSSHPALRDTSGWSNVIITRSLPIQPGPGDDVLMRLMNNQPFLLEQTIGRGRFMLFNARLDNSWTDLPLKPVFVSFMAEAARYLSDENVLQREQLTDSFLQLQSSGQVFDPAGASLLSLEATAQAQEVQLGQIGYYRVITQGGETLIAVNPDLRESNLTVMQPQVLQNWENTVANTAGAAETGQAAAIDGEAPVEVELWRVFLVLLVMMVLAESLLGNRHLRYNTGAPS